MKYLALVCRILLGLMFVVFGANIVHPFLPMPAPQAGTPIGDWSIIMMASGWMRVVGLLQVLGGVLILIGGTVPLGLCILCPISFNILLCHFCLMGGTGIAPGAFTAMLELVLIWAYRANFNGILTTKAVPHDRSELHS